ncbi:MAG: pyridoxal-phosphate dependent enzyme [Brumimicrobium sp.]
MDTNLSILQKVRYSPLNSEPFSFWMKRDDLIDPVVSGNKWRKLKFNIQKANLQKSVGILTFGGAFSNHLIATAKACKLNGLKSVGVVRGEELNCNSNDTLIHCTKYGMELHFVSRSEYKTKSDELYLNELKSQYPHFYIVPEGGANYYGVIGCQEILQETANDFDAIYLAGGTGTTATGILSSAPSRSKIHLVSTLKGDFLKHEVAKALTGITYDKEVTENIIQQLKLNTDSHFGGYGKVNKSLLDFMNDFYRQTNIPLDPIYTGKAMYAMVQDFKKGVITDDNVLFLHTGGLQGAKKWHKELLYLSN